MVRFIVVIHVAFFFCQFRFQLGLFEGKLFDLSSYFLGLCKTISQGSTTQEKI